MKYLLSLFLFCVIITQAVSAATHTPEDEAVFARYLNRMEPNRHLPVNELITETARFFLGTPYVASTLEVEPEQLVINLRQLDCTTLVENCLALALTLKEKEPSFSSFCRKLQQIRYRNGVIANYTSRLHYTSDWIVENQKAGYLKDITQQVGGKPYQLNLFFLSANPGKYKQLKDAPGFVSFMRDKEQEINNLPHYYIPKEAIELVADKIENGDIIGFTTSIKGLDVTHVGYAYRQNGKLTFIHASTSGNKVIINPVSLAEQCKNNNYTTGIIVVRAL